MNTYNDLIRIIIFMFHKDFDVCENHLKVLKKFNPKIQIYAIFGGDEAQEYKAENILGNYFESFYVVKNKNPYWKWKNRDLSVREWYINFGHNVDFDTAFVIEWDLLLLAPLERVYHGISKNQVGLTGITKLEKIASKWNWALHDPYKSELEGIMKYAVNIFGYKSSFEICLGPGYCLPRDFLKIYSTWDIPEVGNDEMRLPLFSKIFGFQAVDTGFYPKWFDPDVEKYFNADSNEIDDSTINRELSISSGVRAFHPYRKYYSLTK